MPRLRRGKATATARWDLPYTGLVSFLRSPTCADLDRLDADIAVLGVPSDEGSPWKPGARFAPRKIRELSLQFAGRGTVDGQRGYYGDNDVQEPVAIDQYQPERSWSDRGDGDEARPDHDRSNRHERYDRHDWGDRDHNRRRDRDSR